MTEELSFAEDISVGISLERKPNGWARCYIEGCPGEYCFGFLIDAKEGHANSTLRHSYPPCLPFRVDPLAYFLSRKRGDVRPLHERFGR